MSALTQDDKIFLRDLLNTLTEQKTCKIQLGKVNGEPYMVVFRENEDPELFHLEDIADIINKLS